MGLTEIKIHKYSVMILDYETQTILEELKQFNLMLDIRDNPQKKKELTYELEESIKISNNLKNRISEYSRLIQRLKDGEMYKWG